MPKGHPAMGSIFMNVSANMLGLDNAATPLGLKAMQELQTLNKEKDTATDAMIADIIDDHTEKSPRTNVRNNATQNAAMKKAMRRITVFGFLSRKNRSPDGVSVILKLGAIL